MGSEHYCLRWNNHQSNLLGVFSQLLESESLVDVTLACTEGPSIRAHKVVLSACSSYFQALFLDHPNRHPIVILKDVRFAELRTLVDFMYKGEVNVEYCQLSALLKTAESLKVKGLADMTNINAAAVQAARDEQSQQQQQSQAAPPTQQQQSSASSSSSSTTAATAASCTPAPEPAPQDAPEERPRAESKEGKERERNSDRDRDCRDRDRDRERDRERDRDRDREKERDKRETGSRERELQAAAAAAAAQQQRDREQRELREHREQRELREQREQRELQQRVQNDCEDADDVDITECPASPATRTASPCPGPLALDRPRSRRDSDSAASLEETRGSLSPLSAHSGPSDMSLSNNTGGPGVTPVTIPIGSLPQSRLPSPHSTEPLAGPSGLPPVQQVPLSLKKEVDWERSTEERSASSEMSSDYRLPPDPELMGMDERVFACMYCGASFHHQSKLTRHILSHSLESLKYREQAAHLQLQAQLSLESAGLQLPPEAHYPPGAGVGPLEPMDFELAAVHSDPTSGVVLCKFCGKSFPDVGSLISHLPAHTGDRPFKCEFCGKAFKLRHHMKDHCRVHTGERPFRCSICGKTFSRSTILKAHEKTHYPKYVRKFLSPSPVEPAEEEAQPAAPPNPPNPHAHH